jgi:four helix bundle protein
MQSFRDLKVWEKAHALALETYRASKSFPSDERFGLVSQMRRAAASVPANIAEGCVRSSDPDFARFLSQGIGSASELEYFAVLARDLAFLSETDYLDVSNRVEEVKRKLAALIGRLQADSL